MAEEKARCAARMNERQEGGMEKKDENGKRARTAAEAVPGPGF